MCDPVQEHTQNNELTYLTEYVQSLQSRIAILEQYAETASPYASIYDFERFQMKFQKLIYTISANPAIPLPLSSSFKELTRFVLPIPVNMKNLFVTANLVCDVNEAIPLYQFAMEVSPNAISTMCSRDRPVFTFYPYSAWPLPNNYLRVSPRSVHITLQSQIVIGDTSKPTELIFYARHGIEQHWDFRRNGTRRLPDYRIGNTEIIIRIESYDM